MSTDLTLQQTNASGPLVPSRFGQVLVQIEQARGSATAPRGVMHGQELRLALGLPLSDGACAAFLLDFPAQGQRVRGAAHGPSAALLAWALHALAASFKCTLFDTNLNHDIDAEPEAHREAAVAYLSAYEADVRATRLRQGENDGAAFLAWLVREEHIALADAAEGLNVELPMRDGPALYELLLENDAVEDVFVSERELSWLLARFHARMTAKH